MPNINVHLGDPNPIDINASIEAGAITVAGQVVGSSTGEASFQFGVHIARAEDYTEQNNFVNLSLDSSRDWQGNGVTYDTDFGWPIDVPNGAYVERIIKYNDPNNDSLEPSYYVRTGTYKIVCQTGWTPSLVNIIGCTQTSSSSGVCTFTVDQHVPVLVWVRMTNNTGSTSSMTPGTFAVFKTENESLWNADEFAIDPYAFDNYSGFSVIRNAFTSTVNADYSWSHPDDIPPKTHFMGKCWPPEIEAKFCDDLGAKEWVQLPTFLDRVNNYVDATSNRMVNVPWPQLGNAWKRWAGTLSSYTSTTIVFPSGVNESDDTYNGETFYASSATTNGRQAFTITDYVGSTRTATGTWAGSTPTGTVKGVVHPAPAPADGTTVICINMADYTPTPFATIYGFTDLGPYVVLNSNGYDFQIAHPSTPTTPITMPNDVTAFSFIFTRMADYEAEWTTYLERRFAERPDPISIQVAPFLEKWNGGYLGLNICQTIGNYLRSGSRVGGDFYAGEAELTWTAWKVVESIYDPADCIRMMESGIVAGNSQIMDIEDINGIIELDEPMANLMTVLSVQDYYGTRKEAIPPVGTLDWYDPVLTTAEIFTRLGLNTINENEGYTRAELIALWESAAFTDADWYDMCLQSLHWQCLHYRLWRNKMADHGKTLGVDYVIHLYETGNHQRVDRPGPYSVNDSDEQMQTSFINWNFGDSTEALAFWTAWRDNLIYNGAVVGMQQHMMGDWPRSHDTLIFQWGALPFNGAEDVYPDHRHYYDFLKANT